MQCADTESWLKPDIASSEIFPPNYQVYRKDREDQEGGGVFILVTNSLISSPLDEYSSDHESLWIQIQEAKGPNIIVGAFYRPPRNDRENLLSFSQVINNVTRTTQGTIILGGDFNLPGVDWHTNTVKSYAQTPSLCALLLDIVQDNGLTQLVHEPTRKNNILDLVLTNNPTLFNNIKTMPPLSTQADHDTVFIDLDIKPITAKQPPRNVPLLHKADWTKIREHTEHLANNILTTHNSLTVQEMWNKTLEGLSEITRTFIPTKLVKGHKDPPWLNKSIKDAFHKRNNAYRKWLRTKSHIDELAFRELKSQAQKMWRDAKDKYTDSILDQPTEDYPSTKAPLKKFWGYIKALRKDSSGVAPLKKDGVLISDARSKANILNTQYASVFTQEDISNIPELDRSPHPHISTTSISEKGVKKLLDNLNPNKAAGPDQLNPRFLKEISKELAPLLTTLFQKSIDKGEVPTQWRTANITPIFKKGEKHQAANYRPVSLTAITSKLLEHIVAKVIMTHLESNKILTECQHGFRSKRSCETQLLNFTQELTKGIAEGRQYDVNVMDFSKAFDKVPHQRLLRKAAYYGVTGSLLKWLESFLKDRTQRVMVDGQSSDYCGVASGVPQGTVMGPILFLIFINDLPTVVDSPCKLFADDLLIYRHISTREDQTILQQDLDKLASWELKWGMQFHPDKCENITITRKKKPLETNYSLRGHPLKKVSSTKYLGVTINTHLDWKEHIDKMTKKANKTLGFLRRNLKKASQNTKETAYKALLRPQLEYCAAIWDPYTKTTRDQIEMVQRRTARFVLHRYHQTSSVNAMLDQLAWETLKERRAKIRLILFYKSIKNLVAVNHLLYLTPHHSITRQQHDQGFQHISTAQNYHQYSFYPRTVPLWNKLPASIVEVKDITTFKKRLANYTLPSRLT